MSTKGVWLVLLLGLFIRFLLAFSTFHPDLVAFHLGGRLILEGNLFGLYDYISNLAPDHPLKEIFPSGLFIYPPLAYVFFGYVSNTLSAIIPNIVHEKMTYDLASVLGDTRFDFLLLLFKMSYLPFDLGVAFLLMKIFKEERSKFFAFVFWIFNPVNIYVTYMMGQFDILPTFFVVFALYLLNRDKLSSRDFYLASFSLGLGASFKVYPLLLLIPLVLVLSGWRERIISFLLGLGVYLVTLVPFLGSSGFRSSALVAEQMLKSFYAQIPISGGESAILYLAVLLFSYLFFYYHRTKAKLVWRNFFAVLLVFFIFTHYHPQWFLWITPFLIIDLVTSGLKDWPLVSFSLFSFFSLLFFFEPSLTIGLFSPIFPALINSKSVWEIMGLSLDINFSRSVLHTVFVAVGLYYLYMNLRTSSSLGSK